MIRGATVWWRYCVPICLLRRHHGAPAISLLWNDFEASPSWSPGLLTHYAVRCTQARRQTGCHHGAAWGSPGGTELSRNTQSVLTSGHLHPEDITGLVRTDPATQKRAWIHFKNPGGPCNGSEFFQMPVDSLERTSYRRSSSCLIPQKMPLAGVSPRWWHTCSKNWAGYDGNQPAMTGSSLLCTTKASGITWLKTNKY